MTMRKTTLLLTVTASLSMVAISSQAANNSKNLFASFVDNWTTVVLWTKADRDAIRAALRG
jgi:hypothetical protein